MKYLITITICLRFYYLIVFWPTFSFSEIRTSKSKIKFIW